MAEKVSPRIAMERLSWWRRALAWAATTVKASWLLATWTAGDV